MISLQVRDSLTTRHYQFSKTPITIGKAAENGPDVPLHSATLESCHVLISEKQGKYLVSNEANDPFVVLNGLPFGKRTLRQGDKLVIHDAEIIFESLQSSSLPILTIKEDAPPSSEISPLFLPSDSSPQDLPPLAKKPPLEKWEISFTDPLKKHLNHWLFYLTCLFLLGGGLLSTLYFAFSEKGAEQELQGGRSLADAGMAFLQARLHRDRVMLDGLNNEFFKDNLAPILAKQFRPLCEISTQGRFVDAPYMLRFFTSENQSRFLLVAQPAYGFLDWWNRKAALVLDSQEMTIRRIDNVKELNRLLVTHGTLDDIDSQLLQILLQQGEVMPLQALGKDEKHREFAPPQGLAYVQPGAENFLYNAPRYYKLTEKVVDLAATWKPGQEQEDTQLREILRPLFALPQLVLYTTQGVETAIQAHRGLSFVLPTEAYVVGYLTLDPDTQKVLKAQLLMPKTIRDPGMAFYPASEAGLAEILVPEFTNQNPLDNRKQWLKRLKLLAAGRQLALQPYLEEMIRLFREHRKEIDPQFKDHFRSALLAYERVDAEQQQKIQQAIQQIFKEYREEDSKASPQEFLLYVKEAGLEASFNKEEVIEKPPVSTAPISKK